MRMNRVSVLRFCVPSHTVECSLSQFFPRLRSAGCLFTSCLCVIKKVFIKMRMPYFKSRQMDSLFHFLRFVHLLLTLRDNRRKRATVFLYRLNRTWRESLKQTTNKKLNCCRIRSCVLSSHFNTAARGSVSYRSYSSQRKTISQGQYQGSPAI